MSKAAMVHAIPPDWLWAASEQLWLHDKHDAYWIEQVRAEKFSRDDWKGFIRAYGLRRGYAANFLPDAFDEIWPALTRLYAPLLTPGNINEINSRWQMGTQVLQELMRQHLQGSFGHNLRSASMKTLWLFQPAAVPMFDKLALAGINCVGR